MRAVFISYRRDDSEGQAGRLYNDLARHFGDGTVFMDVVGIDPGLDFRKVIDKNVSSCGVLLCLIGPAWLDAKDESGKRRLDNPLDFVRLETAAALKRDIPVVPVLVAKARMPRPEQLPDDLKELAYRNGVELTHARWDTDVQVLAKALQRHLENPPPEEARIGAKGDRAQDRDAVKITTPVKSEGAGILRSDRPLPPKKYWRTLVVAAVAALAIAAGVGYALYEKAPSEKEAKVRQAATDAAARQLEEDEKAAADRETARKAAADRDAAKKAAADRETTRRAAADRDAAKKAAVDRETARRAAADREAAQTAAADREAAKKAAAKQVASWAPHVTVRSTNCVALGSGRYRVTVSGDAQAPLAETFGLFAEVLSSNQNRVSNLRPACSDWGPAQQKDGSQWQVSCVHHPNDSPQTKFEVTGIAAPIDGKPPSEGGLCTFKFDKPGLCRFFATFSLNCTSRAQPQRAQASIPNFAGTWEPFESTDNGKQRPVANSPRLTITQNGSLVTIGNHIELPVTGEGKVTRTRLYAAEGQHGHTVEIEGDAALVETLTWRLESSILVFETTFNYKAPYFGHPIGTYLRIMKYRRVSP